MSRELTYREVGPQDYDGSVRAVNVAGLNVVVEHYERTDAEGIDLYLSPAEEQRMLLNET